jgi:DNA helicase INO80
VQDIVVGNKNFTDVTKPSEIVQLLLNEDQLANLGTAGAVPSQSLSGQPVTNGSSESMRELWNEEGDDFFAGKNPSRATPEVMDETGEIGVAVTTKKRTKSSNKARTKPVGGNAAKGSGRASKPKQSAAAVAQLVTAAT